MNLATWMLTNILFIALAVCVTQTSYTTDVAVGQNVSMECGVQSKGVLERLVWIPRDVNSTEWLAYLYDGSKSCDKRIKENCDLSSDGSLELQNVQKTDSGDYFCVLDLEGKYYSQHTLVVHPEVAFKTCPSQEGVFVTRAGPDEIVLAYTNPVCKNADVIGTVTCNPPSGAKIGINVTEIVCTCSHSANVVDTCEIPIPDASPSFENCSQSPPVVGSNDASPSFEDCSESAPVCGSNDDGIVCPQVAAFIFLGIFIGAVLGGAGRLIEYFYKKHSLKQPADIEKSSECEVMLNGTVITSTEHNESLRNIKPELRTHLQPVMTIVQGKPLELKFSVIGYPTPTILWYKDGKHLDPQAGYKITFSDGIAMLTAESTKEGDQGLFSCAIVNPEGDDIISCSVVIEKTASVQPSDGNGTLAEVPTDVRTDSGLPCTNPDESGNTEVDIPGNTEVDIPDGDTNKDTTNIPVCTEIREVRVDKALRVLPLRTNITKGLIIRCMFNENFTVGILGEDAETSQKANILTLKEAKFPLHISCLQCGKYCCSLKLCGDEWSEDQDKDNCKDICEKEDSNETNNVCF